MVAEGTVICQIVDTCVGMDKVDEVLAGLREEQQRLTQELARVEQAIAALE